MFGNGTKTHHGIKGRDKVTGAPAKSVFDNSMTAHVWAQGNQTFGQSSNGNLYFHGRALFSYRHTAPIGWLVREAVSLISSDSYSVSTSGHQWDARRAARGAVYCVPDLDDLLGDLRPPCSGDVTPCERFESAIDSRLIDRAHVRQFVADRIAPLGKLSEETALFLLTGCGLARSLDKIRREAIAKAERAKAKARKLDRAQAIERLKATAAIYRQGRAAMAANLAERVTNYYWGISNGPKSLISDAQARIRKARKSAGKANCPPAVWRDAWKAHALLGEMESDVARACADRAARASRADRIAARRRLIRAFRNSHESGYGGTLDKFDSANPHQYEIGKAIIRACGLLGRAARDLARDLARHLHGTRGVALDEHAVASRLMAIAEGAETFASLADASESMAALWRDYDAGKAERRAREIAEKKEREAQARADWLAGRPVPYGWRPYFARENGAAYIRGADIERDANGNVTGGNLETSQGASVPLVAAIRAFRFIKLVRARGLAWHRNGARLPVGAFQVDSIETNGDFVAGCHRFNWQDVEALALSLGVADLAPDDSAIVRAARAA